MEKGSRFQQEGHRNTIIRTRIIPSRATSTLRFQLTGKTPVTAWAAWLAVLTDGFEAVHQVWERVDPDTLNAAGLKHPLAALIEGWLIGPPVEADERETGILPATLASVRDADDPASLFDLGEREKVSGFTPHPIEQAYLPGLTLVGNEIVPAMPLLMWDASTEGGPRRGKGAPLPLRIWIEAVLALPTHERFSPRRVAVRYGDLTGWLMPNVEYRQPRLSGDPGGLAPRPTICACPGSYPMVQAAAGRLLSCGICPASGMPMTIWLHSRSAFLLVSMHKGRLSTVRPCAGWGSNPRCAIGPNSGCVGCGIATEPAMAATFSRRALVLRGTIKTD